MGCQKDREAIRVKPDFSTCENGPLSLSVFSVLVRVNGPADNNDNALLDLITFQIRKLLHFSLYPCFLCPAWDGRDYTPAFTLGTN